MGVDVSGGMVEEASRRHPELEFVHLPGETFVSDETFDYIVLSDLVPFAHDLLAIFGNVAQMCHARTRVIVHSYSQLWRPAIRLSELLHLKPMKPIFATGSRRRTCATYSTSRASSKSR